MDRYHTKRESHKGVEQVFEDLNTRDKINRNYKIDFEAFNYIDKVIDFKDLWKDYVRKAEHPPS